MEAVDCLCCGFSKIAGHLDELHLQLADRKLQHAVFDL